MVLPLNIYANLYHLLFKVQQSIPYVMVHISLFHFVDFLLLETPLSHQLHMRGISLTCQLETLIHYQSSKTIYEENIIQTKIGPKHFAYDPRG